MTLNFEAGYMHAVFPHATTRRFLAAGAGSVVDTIYIRTDYRGYSFSISQYNEDYVDREPGSTSSSLTGSSPYTPTTQLFSPDAICIEQVGVARVGAPEQADR